MEEKALPSHYAELYEKASSIPQQLDARELALFAGLAPPGAPLRVLDLGCAEGRLSLALAGRGHQVTAADIAQRQLDKAAAEAARLGLPLETARCDIEAGPGPLAGREFDLVYLMDVIEHFKNPVAALEHIRPLLAGEGRLVIHTPNALALQRLVWYLARPRRLIDYRDARRLGDLHFQTYDYLTLEKTLNFVGFKTERSVATRVTVPFLFRSALLARLFTHWADTLLLVCRKAPPIDVEGQIAFWEKTGAGPA